MSTTVASEAGAGSPPKVGDLPSPDDFLQPEEKEKEKKKEKEKEGESQEMEVGEVTNHLTDEEVELALEEKTRDAKKKKEDDDDVTPVEKLDRDDVADTGGDGNDENVAPLVVLEDDASATSTNEDDHGDGDGDGDDQCHVDANAGYDGHAFTWGMAFKVADAGECCAACRAHAAVCGKLEGDNGNDDDGGGDGGSRGGVKGDDVASSKRSVEKMPFWRASGVNGETVCGPDPRPADGFFCNVWVYCPEETCWSNDIHNHTRGECWLKHQPDPSKPYSPSRGKYPEQHRKAHPTSPEAVQWTSGVLVPPGTKVVPGEPSWGKAVDA